MALATREGSDQLREAIPVQPSAWPALMMAIVMPLFVGYIGVVRPTMVQLGLVRSQVARLEVTLHDLRAKTPTADRSVGLLTRLGELENVAARAERSLHRIDRLQDRVARSVARAEQAGVALDRLDAFRLQIDTHAELLAEAGAALASLAELPAEIAASIDAAGETEAALAGVRRLRDRAAEADRLADETLASVDAVCHAQQELLVDAESLAAAHETLDGLTRLESRLNAPLMSVEASHERLDDLVRLKDDVIVRTGDLPDAFETLELMVDLTVDYQRAAEVVRPLRRLLSDLVLLEPSIVKLATVVEPMLKPTGLNGVGGSELRLVLRELRRRHAEAAAGIDVAAAVASNPDETPTK